MVQFMKFFLLCLSLICVANPAFSHEKVQQNTWLLVDDFETNDLSAWVKTINDQVSKAYIKK